MLCSEGKCFEYKYLTEFGVFNPYRTNVENRVSS